jgi:hypothetical protein
MLTSRGGSQWFCDGWRRREFLAFGTLAALRTAADLAGAGAAARAAAGTSERGASRFGAARRCVFLFLTGGPPQHDTWDPKPAAPAQIRGEFSPIATSVAGIEFSELFPKLAVRADKLRVVRSLSHADTVHTTAGYALLTGVTHPRANQVASATMIKRSPDDCPQLGCVAYKARLEREPDLLPPISLPEIIRDANVNDFPGVDAGFLGKRYSPLLVEANPERTAFLEPPTALPVDMPVERLRARMALREPLERHLRDIETRKNPGELESLYHQAFGLLQSPAIRQAFDLERESEAVRAAYGTHLFGKGTLLARRLLEAGATFVTVYWHYEGPDDSPVWDTHENNFRHLRQRLAVPTDAAVSNLLADLADRGMLDDTLVICLGEFGRTPRINGKAGRDHWPHVQTALLAGAGIPGGTVFGASDPSGAYPAVSLISAEDFGTTMLHLLGVRDGYEIHDPAGRPHAACVGSVVPGLVS